MGLPDGIEELSHIILGAFIYNQHFNYFNNVDVNIPQIIPQLQPESSIRFS